MNKRSAMNCIFRMVSGIFFFSVWGGLMYESSKHECPAMVAASWILWSVIFLSLAGHNFDKMFNELSR